MLLLARASPPSPGVGAPNPDEGEASTLGAAPGLTSAKLTSPDHFGIHGICTSGRVNEPGACIPLGTAVIETQVRPPGMSA